MAELPVREMLLYKHGVGFFMRQGDISGEEVTLTFKRDEINDILKSLAVFDAAGGKIRGIHYQTPMDKQARLKTSSVNLSVDESMNDLLRDLRGRQATLTLEITPGTLETLSGRIIGMDVKDGESDLKMFVSILRDDAQVRIFPFDALRGVQIQDEQSAQDLHYFLDTGMAEDDRRQVTLRLTEGDHDLRVYYVAPAPTWRVSYRLVAESDETGKSGKALLQGWGLFDNRLDEDLNDVRVTLVAGQPISFIYDLYASQIPERPVIEDEARIAPGPIEYAGALQKPDDEPVMYGAKAKKMRASFLSDNLATMDYMEQSRESLSDAVEVATETKATGETFQYIVTNPVTVKRGESALVPILSTEIAYERELLYNRNKLADFPVAALRFKNAADLTLERGPVTVIEDNDYRGEAVIPFTREGNDVYVTYAVERGIRIREHTYNHTEIQSINVQDGIIMMQRSHLYTEKYQINNTTTADRTITIERPHRNQKLDSLYETRQPDVVTDDEWRWHVDVPAGRMMTFMVKRREITSRGVEAYNFEYRELENYLKKNLLSQSLFDDLEHILSLIEKGENYESLIENLETEKQKIYTEQENLRKNMGVLQSTGQEATLRNRLLNQLEKTQDRLDEIDNTVNNYQQQIETVATQIQDAIDALK